MIDRYGFSLIELMVVIAIVAVLSAVALPAYKDYVIRSQVVEGLQIIEPIRMRALTYYNKNGTFTGMTFNDICPGQASVNSCLINIGNVSFVGMSASPDGLGMRLNLGFISGFAGHVGDGNDLQPRIFFGFRETNGVLNAACGYREDLAYLNLDVKYRPAVCNTAILAFVGQ